MQRPWGQIVCMSPRACAYAQRRVALHTSRGGNDIPHKGDMTPYTTAQSSYIHVALGTKLYKYNFSSSSHTLPCDREVFFGRITTSPGLSGIMEWYTLFLVVSVVLAIVPYPVTSKEESK